MRDQVVEIFKEIAEKHEGITVKGKKSAYTAVNGNMFSFVDGDGLFCIRLGSSEKAEFETEYKTSDVIQHGAVMRGYVPVPIELLDDKSVLAGWFDKSVANARALKPKPTSKKR